MRGHSGARGFLIVLCLGALLGACGVAVWAAPPGSPGEVQYDKNSLGMEFVMIPAGQFQMGCSEEPPKEKLPYMTECASDEKPNHTVRITKPFEIQKTETTQKQWQAVMDTNPSNYKGEDRPVEEVSFTDIQQFLKKLNSMMNDGYVYRLPTEAEWEYAARAGTNDPYTGSVDDTAWYNTSAAAARGQGAFDIRSFVGTHPVATKQANAWGIYDMRGNVQEWVADYYDPNYYAHSPADDPQGPASGDNRVVRGGSYHVYPWLTTVSVRAQFPEDYSFEDLGFRVVRVRQ